MKTISGYGSGWKLPDKLRIIKPLEGSLTLHQWQRLAKPSLEGIFEERKGVVMRGSRANNLTITEEDQISGKLIISCIFVGISEKFVKILCRRILAITCLFVCNRGDTYYSITAGSKQGSLVKPLSLLFLPPRPVLSSHQHRTLVCLF